MQVTQHNYRNARPNGKLDVNNLDIHYSHLGGLMCQVKDLSYPDLNCKICGKQLQHICQYVSQLSTDRQYRIIHVLICNNNDHYTDSMKVLVTNKTIKQKENQEQTQSEEKNPDPNTMDLVSLTSMMGTLTKQKEQNISQQQSDDQLDFIKREQKNIYQAIDICTSDCEQKIIDFQQGIVDIQTEDIAEKHGYSDALLQTFHDSLFIVGTDRNPLCQQTCIAKMQENDFNDGDFQITKNINQNDDDDSYSDDDNVENDVNDEDYISKQDIQKYQDITGKNNNNLDEQRIEQQKCNCQECKKFYNEYIHELDIFSSIIWHLKMHKEENNADFKILYIFTPRIFEDGVFEGKCIAMAENDEQLQQLLAQLKKNK